MGRKISLKNAWWVVLIGTSLCLVAAILLYSYDRVGVIMYMLVAAVGGAIADTASYSVTMAMMDSVDKGDDRERQYAYIVDTEIFFDAGRLVGVMLFLGMTYIWGLAISLKLVMLVAAGIGMIAASYQYRLRNVVSASR